MKSFRGGLVAFLLCASCHATRPPAPIESNADRKEFVLTELRRAFERLDTIRIKPSRLEPGKAESIADDAEFCFDIPRARLAFVRGEQGKSEVAVVEARIPEEALQIRTSEGKGIRVSLGDLIGLQPPLTPSGEQALQEAFGERSGRRRPSLPASPCFDMRTSSQPDSSGKFALMVMLAIEAGPFPSASWLSLIEQDPNTRIEEGLSEVRFELAYPRTILRVDRATGIPTVITVYTADGSPRSLLFRVMSRGETLPEVPQPTQWVDAPASYADALRALAAQMREEIAWLSSAVVLACEEWEALELRGTRGLLAERMRRSIPRALEEDRKSTVEVWARRFLEDRSSKGKSLLPDQAAAEARSREFEEWVGDADSRLGAASPKARSRLQARLEAFVRRETAADPVRRDAVLTLIGDVFAFDPESASENGAERKPAREILDSVAARLAQESANAAAPSAPASRP